MRKVRFLLFALAVMLGALNVSAKTVYLKPNANWLQDNARFALYMFGGSGVEWTDFALVDADNNIYKATFDDNRENMIFCRMSPSATENNWDNKWNQCGDLAAPAADNQLYTLADGKWDGATVGDGLTITADYEEPVAAGYVVDFNTAITTSSHDFAVASNWKHIVGSNNYDGYGPYYMSYSYGSEAGVDGTGALNIGAQNGYWMGSTQSQANFTDGNYDYLITPLVNGTVTLKVKRYAVSGYASSVNIFKANEAGTVVGDAVEATITPDISDSEWSTLTLTLTEETRLAIRAQAVTIDDFTAESANIIPAPGLTIVSVKRADSESNTYFDMNADGTYTVKYKVKVTNSGETALVAGTTDNYSLSVSINGTLYGTFNVPVDLAVGETSEEFDVSIVMPTTAPTGWKTRYLAENLTGTTYTANEYQWAYSNTLTYNPVPFFIKQGNEPNSKGSSLTGVTSLDFGMIASEITENYEIFAHNAGDLQIKSISAPDGFTVTPAETLPFTITAHSGMNVDVTASAASSASGNMVITYVDKNGADATMNIHLSQTVVDASKWIATFDDNTWPANTVHQSSVSIYNSTYSNINYAVTSSNTYSNLFITPLLTATDGEKFTFNARLSTSAGSVKVYVTTDRSNLGEPVLTLSSSQLSTSEFSAQEVTIENAGNYYIAFEISNAYIDNLYGLEKVDVDHDIMVNSYKIGYYAEDKEIQTGTEQDFNFEILPVQNEAADAYTVKLYANGEAVAVAESVELTAGTAKTFKLKWTPNVASNTTYITYAAIEFTDETKIQSPALNLKVTCEPVFVFFNAGTTVGSSKPSNRTTAITFGKTNELNQVQNFEIYNFGKANLTVKSISVPDGFNVNVANAVVEPATRQPVDITFSATTPGIYEGNLAIVYVDGDGIDQNFELAVSGTLLDPMKWYASFDNTTAAIKWPAGSVYEKNLQNAYRGTYSDNNYYIYQSTSYTTETKFITPKLVANAGEALSFDVAPYSSWTNGSVKVYLSTDRENWGDAIANVTVLSANGTNNFTTEQVTIETAGEYYVAIEPYNAKVDEIYGMTVVPVAHSLTLGTPSIPTEGTQNAEFTASVNVKNFGIVDDEATVTAYVNGAAIATSTAVAIPMNHKLTDAGTALSVSFVYPKAGEYPVYLEVKTGETIIGTTDPVNVTFAEEVASGDVATGESAGTDTTTPLNLYYKKSETIALYTQENLGLSGGEKIKSITWKGYSTKSFTSSLKVYYEWTDEKTISSPASGNYDVTGMTEAINDNSHAWAKVGSSSELGDMIVVNFAEPLIYESGKSLRILVSSSASNDAGYNTFFFEKSTTTNMAWGHQSDGSLTTWYTKNLPLIHIGVEVEAITLAGIVKTSAGAGIEGATVTIKAENGVQYSGTTDAEGAYNFNVIQAGLDFTATVEKEGYLKRQFALNMGGASKVQDVTMYTQMGIVGDPGMGLSWDDDLVMTQSTEDANIFTVVKENVEIAAGTYKYKLRADGAWNLENKYELPNEGDFSKVFTNAGTYTLTFTANTADHTLALNAVAQINKVQIIGSNELPWNGENTFTVDLIKNSEGIYEGTIDLSSVESSTPFKLVINDNTWIGANMLNLVDTENLVSAEGGDGSNFILANATCGYKTYTVTAAWVANDNEASNWTLTIAGSGEKRNVVYAVVGGVKGSTDEAGIFSAYWDAANTTDIMIENGEGKYEWTITDQNLQAQTFEMKVIKKFENFTTALEWIPANNVELEISEFAKYNITVTFDPSTSEVTAIATMAGPATGIAGLNTNTVDGDIYTVGGVRSEKLVKGQMNIIRTSDGKVRKVYVK